jgi:dynein heavy chain, axonemal
MAEWRFFLAGPSGECEVKPNPTNWLDDLEWGQVFEQLYGMSKIECFKGIDSYFIEFQKKFKTIYDSPAPHRAKYPGDWDEKLNSFQKMIILKALRPDKVCLAIQDYVTEMIGKEFIDPPTFNLGECYQDSTNITPLVFVLSPGTDPVADFRKYAEERDMTLKLGLVSLGQGQEKKAEKEIEKAKNTGGWVLLQNCHLMDFWMPRLEAIVEQMND